MNAEFAAVGYALAGLAFAALTVRILVGRRSYLHSIWLTFATSASVLWGVAIAISGFGFDVTPFQLFLVEITHAGFWILFLSMLLGGAVGYKGFWLVRFGGLFIVFIVLAIGTIANFGGKLGPFNPDLGRTLIFGSLLTALIILMAIEQIYRNARPTQRRGLKYLYLGVGGIFAFDLFLYSSAMLSGQISEQIWNARGIVVFLCVPLISIAVHRGPAWLGGIFISRHVVLYTTTLLFATTYLLIIGISGYYIRVFGGEWGRTAQLVFISVAILSMLVILVSDQSRAKLRVYIAKHFFESSYDYRAEWLRLIDTLTAPDEELPLRKRAIKSLAQVLDVPTGVLWLHSAERDGYYCFAGWNTQRLHEVLDNDHSLVRFLRRTGWIVDFREHDSDPTRYEQLKIDDELPGRKQTSLVVPLLHDGALLGFVFLGKPRSTESLNFEDHDLLKTAGKQIASYLAQELSTEQLAESRQFEAFNRLTAYLMHDLKNLIAQQSLVVENAKQHKDNPKFIDDAIATISGGVSRLRRIIDQIEQRSTSQPLQHVELGRLITQVVDQCSDRKPQPRLSIVDTQVWVMADRDRLLMAIYHALRNAQEATDADGDVTIVLSQEGLRCNVIVKDSGSGMDEAFIGDRLFRPFDSTKGTQGMGIGAYQMRETIRSMGGEVTVHSDPGAGTEVCLQLPVKR